MRKKSGYASAEIKKTWKVVVFEMFLFFSPKNGFKCGKGLRFFLQLCLIIVRQETDKHSTIKQRPSAKKKINICMSKFWELYIFSLLVSSLPEQIYWKSHNVDASLSKFEYDKVATVPESWVQWRSDFQSGSRVLKKVFSYLYQCDFMQKNC